MLMKSQDGEIKIIKVTNNESADQGTNQKTKYGVGSVL